jgi:mycofactocin system glycosyltransferase
MVSIIIPVRNRPNAIAECLTSLKKLNYPAEKTEILVVDDASSDHTADVVSEFPVSLLKRKNRCQAAKCRNLAARQAKGEILAFTDSDCLADPLWLLELIPAFCDPAVGIVGGMVESYHREKKLDHYEQVKSSLNMGNWSKSSDEYGVRFYVPSCNLLIRKPLFSKLGGFQERLHVGEDVDLCWRMQDLGYDVEFRPVGKIYHKHRNQLMPFLRRRFDYGTSEPILQKLHREREKELWVPWKATLFLFLVIIFMTTTRIPFLIGSVLLVLVDSFYRLAQLRSRRFEVPYPKVLLSVLRSYGTTVYHYCSFISRYYLVLLLCFLPLLPWISAAIFTAHILAGGVEFFLKRPRLHFLTFLLYFTVEQLSYQLGVWWGCLKNSYFRPIGPKLVFKGHRTSKS